MRPVSELDKIISNKIPVLDKGFIRVVDYMGNDSAIVQAARVSYGEGTKTVREDEDLIRYLMRNKHTSPFEMCEIKFHIKMPIFVARQWVRHRTASINEYSGRYSIINEECYIPENIASQSTNNKQGRDEKIDDGKEHNVKYLIEKNFHYSYDIYERFINGSHYMGKDIPEISREIARMVLPLNTYTEMYWKIDLHNLLHFLRLRLDKNAQLEIRTYAEEILKIIEIWVPITIQAFKDYIINSEIFTKSELKAISEYLKWGIFPSNISKREKEKIKSIIQEYL